jgi:tRNA(Arg) A34 adenosine deaminase TadA
VNLQPSGQDLVFMRMAIELAGQHMRAKEGGPFGALITRGNEIIGRGWNKVTSSNDPTAHAEITAIRAAAAALGTFQLRGCVLYTSCEPCPMCLGAVYWARMDRLVFAANRHDAAEAGFEDEHIYSELARPLFSRDLPTQQALRDQALEILAEWRKMPGKVAY